MSSNASPAVTVTPNAMIIRTMVLQLGGIFENMQAGLPDYLQKSAKQFFADLTQYANELEGKK